MPSGIFLSNFLEITKLIKRDITLFRRISVKLNRADDTGHKTPKILILSVILTTWLFLIIMIKAVCNFSINNTGITTLKLKKNL